MEVTQGAGTEPAGPAASVAGRRGRVALGTSLSALRRDSSVQTAGNTSPEALSAVAAAGAVSCELHSVGHFVTSRAWVAGLGRGRSRSGGGAGPCGATEVPDTPWDSLRGDASEEESGAWRPGNPGCVCVPICVETSDKRGPTGGWPR